MKEGRTIMKRVLAMILALVLALALVACGNKNTDDGKKDNPDDNKTPTVITLSLQTGNSNVTNFNPCHILKTQH